MATLKLGLEPSTSKPVGLAYYLLRKP